VICGLISYIYKPATSSHFKPKLFGTTSLTWSSIDFRNLIREDHYLSRLTNWDSLSFPKFTGSWLPEFARFQSSWNRQQTCDPRSIRQLFHTMLEDQRIVCKTNRTHLWMSPCHESDFLSWGTFTNIFTNSATPTFWGWKLFPQFPNTSPSGKQVDSDDPFPQKSSEFQ
jgi:hypothetical protein